MILRGPVSDALLNAYVDSALSPDMAAAVAARASAEPDLAARIAQLHALKSGVAGLAEAVPPAPPLPARWQDHALSSGARQPRRRALAAAVAACGAGAVLGLAVFATGSGRPLVPVLQLTGSDDRRDLFSDLRAQHDAWVHAADENMPHAPDWLTGAMASAGLRLVHAAPLPDGDGVHLAFIGRNACRISLFEQPGTGEVQAVIRHAEGRVHAARWHTGTAAFTVIARDMNPQRFTLISDALAAASLTRERTNPALLAALAQARQPCLG